MHCVRSAAEDALDQLLAGEKLEAALQQKEREGVAIAFVKNIVAAAHTQHFGLREQLLTSLHGQAVQRHQHAQHRCESLFKCRRAHVTEPPKVLTLAGKSGGFVPSVPIKAT